jgi:hypothetical protein
MSAVLVDARPQDTTRLPTICAPTALAGLELVEAIVGLHIREGSVAADEHAMWILDLPWAQARREATVTPSERPAPLTSTAGAQHEEDHHAG